jgi:hypothetical protein
MVGGLDFALYALVEETKNKLQANRKGQHAQNNTDVVADGGGNTTSYGRYCVGWKNTGSKHCQFLSLDFI